MPYKRTRGYSGWKRRKTRRVFRPRVTAATRIQRAFRRRRGGFNRRVITAVRRNEPCQYALGGTDGLTLTINPVIVSAYSRLPYSQEQGTNVKFLRTAQKCFIKTLTATVKLKCPTGATSDVYNNVCLALVRFKRSGEMRPADLVNPGITGGPLTDSDDKPFLPCQRATAPYFTAVPLEMTTTAVGTANPFMLQTMWNPKVVDVIKKWNVILQQQHSAAGYPVTYPFEKCFTFTHKFNETWKFSNEAPPAVDPGTDAPYNNKNYYLIGWSDSKVAGHPYISTSSRLSFKDID